MKQLITLFAALLLVYSVGAQSYRNEWIDHSKTYYKFKVHLGFDGDGLPIRKGLVRIYQPALASAGLSTTLAENLQLWRNGVEVPIYTSVASGTLTAADYIEFWGEINNGKFDTELYRDSEFQLSDIWSLYADSASYFITTNTLSNLRLAPTPNIVAGNSLPATEYFMSAVSYTHRTGINPGFFAQAAQPLYSSSYDRGEGYMSRAISPLVGDCSDIGLSLNFNNLKPYLSGPTSMILRVNATGNAPNSRTVLVRLNGDTVSNFQMDYSYDAKIEEYGIPVNKISGGTAAFEFVNESSVGCDEFKLAKTELVYPRSLDANNAASLELTLPLSYTGHYLRFYNFSPGANPPILYDLTNGKRYVGDLTITDTIQFVTEPNFTAASFVLVKDDNAIATNIANLQQKNFTNFGNAANQGDYLIISNPLIYGSGGSNYVEQYRQYRASNNGGSYNAKLINIEELVDQFAYGVNMHPLSIRNFLRYARANFTAAPKFVFLIGKAMTYNEYKLHSNDTYVNELNLVPTWGFPASDNLLSADNNLDATPITPIGRLNAVTANEVGDYLLKVKQYDSLQRSTSNTIADKAWMKNVLHVAGANDYNIGVQLDGFLSKYKTIIEDSIFGGRAKNYDKIDDPSGYSASVRDFRSTYESGASLVTYFGHSSATNLDFSLDNPNAYNNQYKYPLFIVNGCDAGNFFNYDPQRFSVRSTISEKFIFEPQRGAIGYMATTGYGVVNYLDSFTRKFYRAIARTQYNEPFGDIVKHGIGEVLATTGSSDYFARLHSEQFTFHGDPAIRINGFSKPDYAIEAQQLTVSPSFVSVADDSFHIKAKVYNIGRMNNDSVTFKVQRQYPGGSSETVYTKKLAPITSYDSVIVALPILANRDKGNNILTITADYNNTVDEIAEDNNSATINVNISDAEIRPVYPYRYAIVNNASFKLAASTANALDTSKTYVMEMDTTAMFNSPIKYTQTKTSIGGIVEFDNGMAMQDSTTYFWRVAVQGNGQHWNTTSFTYRNIANVGFEQKHFYQHAESVLSRLILDSATRKFDYPNKINNLFILHSIYPTSGTEDQQFSIQVNGSGIIASACLGQSVIINVFDTLTFKPWENLTNPFGAEPTCDNSRKYNFEYHYIDYGGREGARQFLESIPNGMYVAVRLVYDWDAVWAPEWKDDELTNGTGISLYHTLKNQGLAIDSFDRARSFGFVFKKNDSAHFSPKYQFTQGVYDRVIMNVDCNTKDTLGYITSPKFGPAKTWKNVKWNGTANTHNFASVDVMGVNNAGTETKLYTLTQAEQNFDITSVSAATYPFIKLKLKNQDSVTANAYQLRNWSVEYDAAPEGAIAPNLFVSIPDSAGANFGDTLKIGVAFKNVSKVNFDSLKVRIVLYNEQGIKDTFNLPKVKPLIAGDTVNIHAAIYVAQRYEGKYNFYLEVNPDKDQLEQYAFNNSLFKYVYFKTGFINANHYYSSATGELHNNISWGTNPDGTGGKPLNFTGTDKIFELANRSGSYNLNSNLSVQGSVILPASSTLNISVNNLSIGKDLTLNGTVIGTGKLVLNGTATQNIYGAGTVKNLELNNTAGATIAPSNKLTITGSYIPANGVLNTNDSLILLSDANNTARIAAGNVSGNYINGKVQVQRFIPGGFRKYRFVGHPFASPMAVSEFADDIDITGAISGSNANNFTATVSNNPSAFTFSEIMDDGVIQGSGNNSGWEALTSGNFSTEIGNGQGIRLLIRGSKGQTGSLTGTAYTPANVTLKMNGVPKQGDFVLPLAFTDVAKGWNFVANPYASNINWLSVDLAATDNAVYSFRPTFNGGVYASYVNGSATNGASNIIESSSGFFVRANGLNPSLGFHESNKVEGLPSNTMFRNYTNINNRLMLQLKQDSLNMTDDIVVRFGDDNATDGFDAKFDAYNLPNTISDLYVLDAASNKYSIYHGTALMPASVEEREVTLGITATYKGNYSITAKTLNAFINGNKAYLKDKELDILTEITDSISYSFNVADLVSVKSRFSIVFNAKKDITVPAVQPFFSIKVSPNPARNIVNLVIAGLDESSLTTIRFISSNGMVMKTINAGNLQGSNYQVDIKDWANGIYVVELVNGKTKQTISLAKQGN